MIYLWVLNQSGSISESGSSLQWWSLDSFLSGAPALLYNSGSLAIVVAPTCITISTKTVLKNILFLAEMLVCVYKYVDQKGSAAILAIKRWIWGIHCRQARDPLWLWNPGQMSPGSEQKKKLTSSKKFSKNVLMQLLTHCRVYQARSERYYDIHWTNHRDVRPTNWSGYTGRPGHTRWGM